MHEKRRRQEQETTPTTPLNRIEVAWRPNLTLHLKNIIPPGISLQDVRGKKQQNGQSLHPHQIRKKYGRSHDHQRNLFIVSQRISTHPQKKRNSRRRKKNKDTFSTQNRTLNLPQRMDDRQRTRSILSFIQEDIWEKNTEIIFKKLAVNNVDTPHVPEVIRTFLNEIITEILSAMLE